MSVSGSLIYYPSRRHQLAPDLAMFPSWKAVRQDGAATMDRIQVAVSGYALSEQAEGTAATIHAEKTGEIGFISAGPARRWTNTASTPAHHVVVTFR